MMYKTQWSFSPFFYWSEPGYFIEETRAKGQGSNKKNIYRSPIENKQEDNRIMLHKEKKQTPTSSEGS